jgi:uncharacterized protein
MKKNRLILISLAVIFLTGILQTVRSEDIPDKPNPPRLVNDFAGMLDRRAAEMLERKLDMFSDSTSTQIAIVTVPSLNGYDKSDYAQRLGEKWGIGAKGKNNGVLILIKPKTADSRGEVFITTGYGLEGKLPDLTCSDIVNNEMLPSFRSGDYIGGISNAVSTIMSLTRGEFTADEYGRRMHGGQKKGGMGGIVIFVIILVIISIFRRTGGMNNRHIGSSGLPFWMLMSMMNSGGGSRGSWGDFSGGGGGGGGFGGFGGGSFGGGGAGGSW